MRNIEAARMQVIHVSTIENSIMEAVMYGFREDLNTFEERYEGVSEETVRLHKAAANGSPDDVRAIIASGTDVDARDSLKMTPLMSAAYNERLDNLTVLLEAGADVRAIEFNDLTVLHFACKNNGIDCAEALVAAGADMESVDDYDNKPLHLASIFGYRDLLEYYISRSKSLDVVGYEGQTPLLMAAVDGKLHNFEALIKHGANISVKDEFESGLLHHAAANSDPEILRRALNLDVSIEARDISDRTPLFIAAFYNKPENVRILLNAGADMNARNRRGETALHEAAVIAGEEVVKILATSKSFVNMSDSMERTALHAAALQNNLAAAKALLESDADINSRDKEGFTPILTATEANGVNVVKLLFEAGADTSIIGNDGSDMVSLATMAKNSSNKSSRGDESWKFLKEKGFPVQQDSESGSSAEAVVSGSEKNTEEMKTDENYLKYKIDYEGFTDWAHESAKKGEPVKFVDVLHRVGIPVKIAKNPYKLLEMTDAMASMGIGMAPHFMLLKRAPGFNESVFLYETYDNHQNQNEKNERLTCEIINLGIGAYVLSLGQISPLEIGSALRKVLPFYEALNESQMTGLQANIEYFKVTPPVPCFVEDLLDNREKEVLPMVRRMGLEFVRALNAGMAKKMPLIESFYNVLGVDPMLARSDLKSGVPRY